MFGVRFDYYREACRLRLLTLTKISHFNMSDPPIEKHSRKSRLMRPFKGLISKLNSRSPSSSSQGAQSVNQDKEGASRPASPTNSVTSASQVNLPSHQGVQLVTFDNASTSRPALSSTSATTALPIRVNPPSHQSITPHNATPFISALPTNNTISVPQVIPQGTEYKAILELSATPSDPLTWEHRMKEWGSTTYEGLKTAIQGIYDCSNVFPPLQATAGVLLTISKVVDVRGSL